MMFVLLKLLSRRALVTFSVMAAHRAAQPWCEADAAEVPFGDTEENSRCIRYYGPIEGSALMELNGALVKLAEASTDTIDLHLQSSGGELIPALYTADLIRDISKTTPVHTYVDGYAASAATLLSVSGEKRFITQHSSLLIHQLSSKHEGTYQELVDAMKNDQLLMRQIVSVYKRTFRGSEDDLLTLLNRNLLLDAATCLRFGLVDVVY
tara:strand:+ start:244 stop:870 length:627 start_codon:yes stop_codon:yes gene_type:complete